MDEIFSRFEYPIADSISSDDVFEKFRQHFDITNTASQFCLAVRLGDSKAVVILTGNPEIHAFVKLLLAGEKDLRIDIYKGK